MRKVPTVVRGIYWYVSFFIGLFFIDFYGINGGLDDPSSFGRMAISVTQVLLQLSAAHFCIKYGGKVLPFGIKYGIASALLLMALRRMTAFMIMFEKIEAGSLIQQVDKLVLPITISFILFLCFFSLRDRS